MDFERLGWSESVGLSFLEIIFVVKNAKVKG
jgi:hypothetical protein